MKKNENNFKKAMNELLNLEGTGGRSEEQDAQSAGRYEDEIDSLSEMSAPAAMQPDAYTVSGQAGFERPSWETVITQDVVIDGNITSGSNLKILGTVQGNVSCEGTVVLSGSVEGDLLANSLKFQAGRVHGNIKVQEDMVVDKNTSIKGDIVAANVVFGGQAEGNFHVRENLELRETASVIGNIRANGIAMYNGSRVKGLLDIGGEVENLSRGNED